MITTVQDLLDAFLYGTRYEKTTYLDIAEWNDFMNSIALDYYMAIVSQHHASPVVQTKLGKFRIITNGKLKYRVTTAQGLTTYNHYYPLAPVYTTFDGGVYTYHSLYYIPSKTNYATNRNNIKYFDYRLHTLMFSNEYPNIASLNNINVLKYDVTSIDVDNIDDENEGAITPPPVSIYSQLTGVYPLIINDDFESTLLTKRYYKKPNTDVHSNRYYGNIYDGSHEVVTSTPPKTISFDSILKVSFDPYIETGSGLDLKKYLYCIELDYYRYPAAFYYDEAGLAHIQPEFSSEDLEQINKMAIVKYLERIGDERYKNFLQTKQSQ